MHGLWLQSVPTSTIVVHLEVDYPLAPGWTTQLRDSASLQELTKLVQIVPRACCNSIVSAALQAGTLGEVSTQDTWGSLNGE